jgi:MHS family proline/betaine transporter-like MFS transporter
MKKNLSILLGNFLEFYDFTLFAYLLPILSVALFPDKTSINAITSGYLFLAIGFLGRPIGAMLFGYIGDNFSRKTSMVIAILLMSISTTFIGFLSTDIMSTNFILTTLVICRLLQGLSAGGEYGGAGLLLVENSNKKDQYLKGAMITFSGLCGACVASIAAAVVSLSIFPIYSWRILFIFGGIVGFIGLWLRISMVDEKKPKIKNHSISWLALFAKYRVQFLCTIIFGGLMNVPFYMVTGFLNTYLISLGAYDKSTLMFINAFVVLFCASITLALGFLSRVFNPLKMMLTASLGMTLFSFPFFFLVQTKSLYLFVGSELILIFLSQMFVAPAFTTMARLFPYEIRYRGLAMGNCIGMALLGGSTPYISAHLIKYTGVLWSPAIYLFSVSVLGVIAVIMVKYKLEGSFFNIQNELVDERQYI